MPRYSRPLTRFLGRPLFPRAFHGLCHGAVPDSRYWMIRPVMTSYTFGIVFFFCLVIDLRQERQRGALRPPCWLSTDSQLLGCWIRTFRGGAFQFCRTGRKPEAVSIPARLNCARQHDPRASAELVQAFARLRERQRCLRSRSA